MLEVISSSDFIVAGNCVDAVREDCAWWMELGDGIVGPELSAAKQGSVISQEGKEGMFVAAFVQWEVLFVCKAP